MKLHIPKFEYFTEIHYDFALFFSYSSSDPKLVTAWPDNAILKIESIPHHFTAFSIRNCGRQPTLIVHCLDYVSQ